MNPDTQEAESHKYTHTARVMRLSSGRWAVFDQAWKGLQIFETFAYLEDHIASVSARGDSFTAPRSASPKTALAKAVKNIDEANAILEELGLA